MKGGPEAGSNRTHRLPDATAGNGMQEAVHEQTYVEAFLEGHPRGTPRYKAAADLVAWHHARYSQPDGKISSEGYVKKLIKIGAIEETIRKGRNEPDGEGYEEALRAFGRKVIARYTAEEEEEVRKGKPRNVDQRVAQRMMVDWKSTTEKTKTAVRKD